MIKCRKCGERESASILGLCIECIRSDKKIDSLIRIHQKVRDSFNLPLNPPKSKEGVLCNLCSNECSIGNGETGYCGLRENIDGKLISKVGALSCLAYLYLDPLPTNCCAAWFCEGTKGRDNRGGYNLAVFFYGCNFDCLFCQNPSHKDIDSARTVTSEEFLKKALDAKVRCICFFGGSPEPQLQFALNISKKIIEKSNNKKRICWEWNGCGNEELVLECANISKISGGIVKFDLKTYNENLSYALSGVSNKRAYKNFENIARKYPEVLTATTLLVSYYVDKREVESIARFISELNPDIPYSLLVFHPDFYMSDLPITPKSLVYECYEVAKKYLKNVNIGNKHLIIN